MQVGLEILLRQTILIISELDEFLRSNYHLITHIVEILAAVVGIFSFKKFTSTSAKFFIIFLVYVVFVEQLKNFFNPGDVIIGISGSGNSSNVLKAIEFVNNNNGVSIGWTGFDGGQLKEIAHHSINANINDMQISEDIHMTLVHMLMKMTRKGITRIDEPKVRSISSARQFTLRRKTRV